MKKTSRPRKKATGRKKTTGKEKPKTKRRGPPNRMNDLNYSTWMKFQKSFVVDELNPVLVEKAVRFFTKARWPDGTSSKTIVAGFPDFNPACIESPREISTFSVQDMKTLFEDLSGHPEHTFDFILVNLLTVLPPLELIPEFLESQLPLFFKELTRLLVPARYCGILTSTVGRDARGFPLPWAISEISRQFLRLRDEKLYLSTKDQAVDYLLHFQAIPEERKPAPVVPETFSMANSTRSVRPWTIPRPPPRTKGEILHPAKFPETLVEEFIQTFSHPGDLVLDPMAGTGSTVIAAVQNGRRGLGLELSAEFADLARIRFQNKFGAKSRGKLGDIPNPETVDSPAYAILEGDATNLEAVEELKGLRANYSITSPPYWSMLKRKGSEYQRSRRSAKLKTHYSDDPRDLGNVTGYHPFLDQLVSMYEDLGRGFLEPGGILTIILKYIKREHLIYGLPWDLARRLCVSGGVYDYLGTTFWCQDDVPMRPFAVGIIYLTNTVHQYCLHFRKNELLDKTSKLTKKNRNYGRN